METVHLTENLKIKNSSLDTDEDPLESIFERGHKRKKYENFSDSQLEILNSWFSKSIYPKIEDFDSIANEILQPKKKIQNWFKYKRRLTVLENENKIPQYKTKKVLSPKVFETLKEYFKINQNPCLKEFRDLAKKINLKEKQIISWFTYRRRKLKLSRKQQLQEIKSKNPMKSNRTDHLQENKEKEIIKHDLELQSNERPSKKIHLEDPRFLENPLDSLTKNMNFFNDAFPIKREFNVFQNTVNHAKMNMPWPGSQTFNNEICLSNYMNSNQGLNNLLQNNILNANFNNFPLKPPSNLQNFMMRNMNSANLTNLSLLYNKMMPKLNMLPQLYMENLMNMNANPLMMPRNQGLEHANYNQCGLYGNLLHTNNNGISVAEKLEIKQENI